MEPVYLGTCPQHNRVKELRKSDKPWWLLKPLSPSEMEEKRKIYETVYNKLKSPKNN